MEEQRYKVGENVLCEHMNYWYRAKIVDKFWRYNRIYYMVHYVGWKNAWDESVLSEKLCPETAKNLSLLENGKQHLVANGRLDVNGQKTTDPLKKRGRRRKRKNALFTKPPKARKVPPPPCPLRKSADFGHQSIGARPDPGLLDRPQLNGETEQPTMLVQIPDLLADVLHDEQHIICSECWLPWLPASPNVREILSTFAKELQENELRWSYPVDVDQFTSAIIALFNRVLPYRLLHRFERLQLVRTIRMHPDRKFCDIYGYPHIIRLCYKLSELFSESKVKNHEVRKLIPMLEKFLKFLENHESDWLTERTYQSALPAYTRATFWD